MKRRSFIPGQFPAGKMTLKEKLAHHYAFTEGPGDYFHEFRAFIAGWERARTAIVKALQSADTYEWDQALIERVGEEDVPSG